MTLGNMLKSAFDSVEAQAVKRYNAGAKSPFSRRGRPQSGRQVRADREEEPQA